jgi:hypothetical protein
MSQNLQFQEQIKQWVNIDNQIHILSEKLRDLRDKKTHLTEQLSSQSKSMPNGGVVQITDGKLKFVSTKVHSPLTFKYLERTLGDVIKSKEQVSRLISYIKDKRETKMINEIKRFSQT